MTGASVLVNHWYAHPLGHCVEALRYALGYKAADPSRRVSLLLNSNTPTELVDWSGYIDRAYGIDFPFWAAPEGLEPDFDGIPRDWDWVLDEARRIDPRQRMAYRGFARYYELSDYWFRPQKGRGIAGHEPPSYLPHQQVKVPLPEDVLEWAAGRVSGGISVMPAGSGPRERYPSVASWEAVLDALRAAWPDIPIVLLGKLASGRSTSSSFTRAELDHLLSRIPGTVDCFDIGLARQLAAAQASKVFISPHTGFGMAVLTVGTPWLTISGGTMSEYFFNGVPFRSILPDPRLVPFVPLFTPWPDPIDDHGPRLPEASSTRIGADLDRILIAADELINGSVSYDRALSQYFGDLLAYRGGDTSSVFSIDDVHLDYI